MFLTKEQFSEEYRRWENRLVGNCKICNGVGYSIDGDKNVMCTCMENAILFSNLVSWGIPRKYLTWEWNQCDNSEFVRRCKSYVDDFINGYYDGKGVYLFGPQGRGKSTMEALIARDVTKQINPDTKKHFKVAFVIFEELVQLSHQSRVDRMAKQKLDAIISMPELLIIDNLGSETGLGSETKHNVRLLELIIRKRDNNCVPTIISSNFTIDELKTNYSDTIKDFIEQNYEIISVTGENFRQKNGETNCLIDDWSEF